MAGSFEVKWLRKAVYWGIRTQRQWRCRQIEMAVERIGKRVRAKLLALNADKGGRAPP